MAIIGIDLGTTNSLGCVYQNGEPMLIANSTGSYLTPSAVSVLDDGSVIVGQAAKERMISHPESTILSFKKDMGTDIKYHLGKHTFSPEALSALVIQSIVQDAERILGESVTEAIISVPAYFNDKQRAATKRAGALAGVTVNRILNEPSAAALAIQKDSSDERAFLVFDFGGGTLDVTIVNCIDHIVQIQKISGNNRLGGDDIDALMAESILQEFSLAKGDITPFEYSTLIHRVQECKEALSSEESAVIHISLGGTAYESTYTQKRLMDVASPLLLQIRDVIANVLRDAKLKANQVSEIIMVGGSSKMPLIQRYLRHLFHKQPVIPEHCDNMIALGLGAFCGIYQKNPQLSGYHLTDVCPFSLGVNTYNASGGKSFMSVLIPRNSILPCSKTSSFTTVSDFQKAIEFKIYQGENLYADDNLFLDSIKVPLNGELKEKESAHVTFTYDINGILIIDIHVPSTGKEYSKVISQTVSPEELAQMTAQLKALTVNPEELDENKQILEKLQQAFQLSSPSVHPIITDMIQTFTLALHEDDLVEIAKYRKWINKNFDVICSWEDVDLFDATSDASAPDDDWDDPWAEDDDSDDDDSFLDFSTNNGGILS